MKGRAGRGLMAVGVLLILAGCATTPYQLGRQAMAREDYDQAKAAFAQCLRENVDRLDATRELGVIFYLQGRYNVAKQVLQKVYDENPNDGRTLLYLGSAHEALGEYSQAIDVLKRFDTLGFMAGEKGAVAAKLDALMRAQMAAEARQALAQESFLDSRQVPENSVAVLYFSNLGNKRGLDPLQKGMADMVITDLSKVQSLKVIERVRLQSLMDEMRLDQAALVQAGTAPRLGLLLGAAKVINGNFIDLSGQEVRIHAGLVNALQQNESPRSTQVQGSFTHLFELEKELVFGLVDRLGIRLTQAERDEIGRIPTENILAFVAYSRGLDYEDRGLFGEAQGQYQQALRLDPSFGAVGQAMNRVEVKAQGSVNLVAHAPAASPGSSGGSGETRSGAATSEAEPARKVQMVHMGQVLNQRFLPGIDSRNAMQEQQTSSLGDASLIQLVIPLTGIQ